MKYILILILSIAVFFSGCSKSNSVDEFKIGTNSWPGYEPLHLALIDKKYTKNVSVTSYSSSTVVLNKFRKSEIHAAALTLDEVVLLKDQGYSPVVVAILDISDGADVILAKDEIKTLHDLKGKSIGVENSALGAYILVRALEKAKLEYEDVNVLSLGINKHEEAFKADIIDAVITFEPVRSSLLSFGAKEIFTSKDIPSEIVDVLVVDKKYAKSEYISDILHGWSNATSKISSMDVSSIEKISKRLNQTKEEFIASLDGLKIPTLDESQNLLKDGSIENTIEKIQKIMLEKGLIKNSFNSKDILPK